MPNLGLSAGLSAKEADELAAFLATLKKQSGPRTYPAPE
jgi:hypothetical protein